MGTIMGGCQAYSHFEKKETFFGKAVEAATPVQDQPFLLVYEFQPQSLPEPAVTGTEGLKYKN